MMRLALIYSAYPPIEEISQADGGAGYCKQLAEHLAAHGYEVHVITSYWSEPPSPEENGTQHPNGVRVHRVVQDWGLGGLCRGEYASLRRCLEGLDPAAILVVFPGGGLGCSYQLPTLVKFACRGKPVITILFAFVVRRAPFYLPLFLCAEAALLATSSKICFESAAQMAWFSRLMPFLRPRLVTISSGPTMNIAPCSSAEPLAALRRRLGLKPATNYVAFLGQFRRNKNVALFLRSAKRVVHRNPDTEILFIGGRSPQKMCSRYERRMLRLIEELGLAPVVHFTGFVDEATFGNYLCASDLCVFSFDEWLGRSTVSVAAVVGRPIVILCRGNHPFLKHGESAWLVEAHDKRRLGVWIEQILRDGVLRKRLAAGAREAARLVSWENLILQWDALIQSTVLSGAAPDGSNGSSASPVGSLVSEAPTVPSRAALPVHRHEARKELPE